MEELLERLPELKEVIGDTTEQSIERPQKKRHTIKTQIVINKNRRVYDVSQSYPGHVHDKTIMSDKENTPDKIPKPSKIRLDNGFQKIQKEYSNHTFILPEKANRWHKLTKKQKKNNKIKAKERIVAKHVFSRLKTFRILSHKYRHNVSKHNRTFKNLGGIWNLRLKLGTVS